MRHVAASVFKRLERLEQAKSVVKHIGAWGDIEYDLDKWSALAEASQAALVLKALEREPEPGSAPKPNPMDVSYKYKTNLHPR